MPQEIVQVIPDIPKHKTFSGRPQEYGDEIREEILNRMREGQTPNQICRDPHMPDVKTIDGWRDKDSAFNHAYAQARSAMVDCWGSQILDIADDSSKDIKIVETKNGPVELVDHEVTKRSELRINTRKWLMSKMRPELYGDKLEVQNNVNLQTQKLVTLENTLSNLSDDEYEALSILIDNTENENEG